MVRVAFYKGKGNLFDKLIRWWTKSPYSHCEVVINNIWYSSSPVDLSVRAKQISCDYSKWDFILLTDDAVKEARMIEYFYNEQGKKYDWLGIVLSQVIPLDIQNPNRWFCSEISSAMLMHGGCIDMKNKASWYSPQRLYKKLKG